MSLSNSCQEDKLSVEVVEASLLNEEMRRNEGITKACQAVGIIREDVDKLAEQVNE